MVLPLALLFSCLFFNPVASTVIISGQPTHPNATKVCQQLASSLSKSSSVVYPGSDEYALAIAHFSTTSTTTSACAVEPGTAEDVAIILKKVGSARIPFAIKGGGHATNPGYSSTTGVHVAMKRFSDIVYDKGTSTVVVGAGLLWNDVYRALEKHGVTVVGGRVGTVGVAGLTLGGGYSWLSSQHGLALDNVVAYELVLPTGKVQNITEKSDPDVFFALRGGFNNFGVITRFTLKTYPQGLVWGGIRYFSSDQFSAVLPVISNFAHQNKNTKAGIIAGVGAVNNIPDVPSGVTVSLLLFYDGASPPPQVFDELLSAPAIYENVSTHSYFDLIQLFNNDQWYNFRTSYDTVPVTDYPVEFIEAMIQECQSYADALASAGPALISSAIEPFSLDFLSHSRTPSAYPPSRSTVYFPTVIQFSWTNASSDSVMLNAIRAIQRALTDKATELGQDLSNASSYGNYAISGTSLEKIYGKNLPRLQAIHKRVDPFDIMSLAGGWKF